MRLAKAIENVLEITFVPIFFMFRFRVVFTPNNIILIIIVPIIVINDDDLWISFFSTYKDKNESTLSH